MSARSWPLAWLAGLLVCLSSLPAMAETPAARKTVLTIYSQARESAAISIFDQSLRKTLQSTSGGAVTSYAEFMDIQRFSGDGFVQAFRDYLSQKYQGQQVDALMLIGPAAAGRYSIGGRCFRVCRWCFTPSIDPTWPSPPAPSVSSAPSAAISSAASSSRWRFIRTPSRCS